MLHTGRSAKRILVAIGVLVAVLAAVFFWYASDYYRADSTAAIMPTTEITATRLAMASRQ